MLFGEQEYDEALELGLAWREYILRNAPVRDERPVRRDFIKKLQAIGMAAGAASTFLNYIRGSKAAGVRYIRRIKDESDQDLEIGAAFVQATKDSSTPDTEKRPSVPNSTRGPKVFKNAGTMKNWQEEAEGMDVDSQAPVLAKVNASTSTGTQTGGRKNEQTPITRMPPRYGFPNTATHVLHGTNYFTVVTSENPGVMMAARFRVRLTSMLDQIITTPSTVSSGATFATGIFSTATALQNSAASWSGTGLPYPDSSGDNLFMRSWLHKMYRYYAVLGVEYELECVNMRDLAERDVVVARWIDTYSDVAATVHPTGGAVTMEDMMSWKDVKWDVVPSATVASGGKRSHTIRGYYKSGMVKQNVENDDDVDTWTQVGQTPKLNEELTFAFGKHWNSVFNTAGSGCNLLNCRLTMRYIVQYKDLIPQLEWPTEAQTPVTFSAPTDILST